MRTAAFVALIAGAAGSIGLLLHARQHPPPLLVFLFVIWVLSPFVVLGIAHLVSKRRSPGTQATLCFVSVFIAIASLLVYGDDTLNHRTTHPAFVYVAVPPVSWLLIILLTSMAAIRSRKTQNQ